MTGVTFAEFFEACKDRLTDIQLRALNPQAEYFRMGEGWLGCFVREYEGKRMLWISIFVGGMRDLWALRRAIEAAKVDEVSAECRKGSVVERLAFYYGASMVETGEFYPDGVPVLLCRCQPLQTLRFKKVKEKELQKV